MVDRKEQPLKSDDDMLSIAKACEQLGQLGWTRPQTQAERLEELVEQGKIESGVSGKGGKLRFRRGNLRDACFEHYFGRKRPKSSRRRKNT